MIHFLLVLNSNSKTITTGNKPPIAERLDRSFSNLLHLPEYPDAAMQALELQ
jgi:hypothetical protein